METNELIALAGVFVGGIIAGAVGYLRKPRAAVPDPVLTGVGLELGNREQMKELIEAVKDIGKAIRDDRETELTDTMEELMEELRRRER